MDELSMYVNSIVVSDDPLNPCANYHNIASNVHPRLDLYKRRRPELSSQEQRRKQILNEQKKKRASLVELKRPLVEKSELKVLEDEDVVMEKPVKTRHRHKRSPTLMFSEWLEEVPADLVTHWIMVVCPVGKRCLVVARDGSTYVYNKGGKQISRHSSRLPGGSKESKCDETILDCIYSEAQRCYYVLDCLCWKSHPITDTESEFRFYWLKYRLSENEQLSQTSQENPYVFRDIPRLNDCSFASIQAFCDTTYQFEVDGALFYHKEAHYTHGHTPLVGWLKLYMLPEILNIPVPLHVMLEAPTDYTGARQCIDKSNIEIQKMKDLYKKSEKASDGGSKSNKVQHCEVKEMVDDVFMFKENRLSFGLHSEQ